VEYSGSGLLSEAQIKKLLKEKEARARNWATPENSVCGSIATRRAIESTLEELAHPHAHVEIIREESSQATVAGKVLQSRNGPHLPVGRVLFEGNPAVSEKKVEEADAADVPIRSFAGVRGKCVQVAEGVRGSRDRLLAYPNHAIRKRASGRRRPTNTRALRGGTLAALPLQLFLGYRRIPLKQNAPDRQMWAIRDCKLYLHRRLRRFPLELFLRARAMGQLLERGFNSPASGIERNGILRSAQFRLELLFFQQLLDLRL